jgi:hypothetical protein
MENKMSITVQDVQSFIDTNKDNPDVTKFVSGLVTPDRVNAFLTTDDGKKLIQPTLDSYHAKSLEGWKKTNLQKVIDEEVTKRNPAESEDQKRLRKIEQDNQALQSQIKRGQLKDALITQAQKDSFPLSLIDYAIGEDEQITNANYAKLKDVFSKALDAEVDVRFKTNGRTPPPKNNNEDKNGMNNFIRKAAGR